MKLKVQILIFLSVLIFALLFDSLSGFLPFQAAIVIVLTLSILTKFSWAFFCAFFLGVFLDSSFALPSGVFLSALLISLFIIVFLIKNFFPQLSFYSVVILIPLGTLFFEIAKIGLTNILYIFKISELFLMPHIFYILKVIFWNTIVSIFIFLFISRSRRHLINS